MPSPRASPASSPSAAAAAATNPPGVSASSHAAASAGTTNPSPASTLHAPPHFTFLSPSLPGPAQVQSLPHSPATVAPIRAAGGAASAGAAAVQMPRSLIAGSLQKSVHKFLDRLVMRSCASVCITHFNTSLNLYAAASSNISSEVFTGAWVTRWGLGLVVLAQTTSTATSVCRLADKSMWR